MHGYKPETRVRSLKTIHILLTNLSPPFYLLIPHRWQHFGWCPLQSVIVLCHLYMYGGRYCSVGYPSWMGAQCLLVLLRTTCRFALGHVTTPDVVLYYVLSPSFCLPPFGPCRIPRFFTPLTLRQTIGNPCSWLLRPLPSTSERAVRTENRVCVWAALLCQVWSLCLWIFVHVLPVCFASLNINSF